jgi:hypothetical protein
VRGSWRKYAAPIIEEVIRCCGYHEGGCDLAFVRKALSATYPFGERHYWPYKVWCDETRRQLKLKRKRIVGDQRQTELPLL